MRRIYHVCERKSNYAFIDLFPVSIWNEKKKKEFKEEKSKEKKVKDPERSTKKEVRFKKLYAYVNMLYDRNHQLVHPLLVARIHLELLLLFLPFHSLPHLLTTMVINYLFFELFVHTYTIIIN